MWLAMVAMVPCSTLAACTWQSGPCLWPRPISPYHLFLPMQGPHLPLQPAAMPCLQPTPQCRYQTWLCRGYQPRMAKTTPKMKNALLSPVVRFTRVNPSACSGQPHSQHTGALLYFPCMATAKHCQQPGLQQLLFRH